MSHLYFSRRAFISSTVLLMTASCGNRQAENQQSETVNKRSGYAKMDPVIGYWRWDETTQAMYRPDGAFARYIGVDRDRPATAVTMWLQFEVVTPVGHILLPVQQRIVGRDTNFRALWYNADFVGQKVAPELWVAAERLIGDALTSWPRGKLADALPTGIGIWGGYVGGRFRDNLYRLYLPEYVGKPSLGGSIAPISAGKKWSLSSSLEHASNPIPVGEVICELTSETAQIDVEAGEHGTAQLHYEDDNFESDRFQCTMPYTDQQWMWSIFEFGGSKEKLERKSSFFHTVDNLFGSLKRNKASSKTVLALTSDEQERAYAAFHDAFFTLPANAVRAVRLHAPPIVIKSKAPWRRAGYLDLNCLTATALRTTELQNCFSNNPAPEDLLVSPAGAAFDPEHGILTAPNGAALAIQQIDEMLGLTPTRLRLRCQAFGLDWPILVRRIDRRPHTISWAYEPQLLSRWHIDHQECLEAWRREGHKGLPDPGAWDAMRQFVEEGILSWGDGRAGGPAPQSLATNGGWYDGKWRGAEFQRLLGRPINSDKIARTDGWRHYEPAARWHRTDTTPTEQLDPASLSYTRSNEHSVPFNKLKDDNPHERLFASGFIIHSSRDYDTRHDIVDYRGPEGHVRLGGTRDRLVSAGVIRIDENAPVANEHGRFVGLSKSMSESPSLDLWRGLRDAAEGGLRDGESMTVIGGYFLDRLYGNSLRITALSAEIVDFDYRMFDSGTVFV